MRSAAGAAAQARLALVGPVARGRLMVGRPPRGAPREQEDGEAEAGQRGPRAWPRPNRRGGGVGEEAADGPGEVGGEAEDRQEPRITRPTASASAAWPSSCVEAASRRRCQRPGRAGAAWWSSACEDPPSDDRPRFAGVRRRVFAGAPMASTVTPAPPGSVGCLGHSGNDAPVDGGSSRRRPGTPGR